MSRADGEGPREKRGRITRSRDFDAVYRRGRSAANRHMVVYAFPREREGDTDARLGLSVSKKVGGAVQRNRVKRVLREQFAGLDNRVPAGQDVVVIARRGLAEYADEQGSAAVGARLGELLERLFEAGGATP
ncbi:MAG: ribonuclease P protein component [Thermoleophilia bacterium]|nr:ribonuclease P protein component [Thermoleophilia bacterium]